MQPNVIQLSGATPVILRDGDCAPVDSLVTVLSEHVAANGTTGSERWLFAGDGDSPPDRRSTIRDVDRQPPAVQEAPGEVVDAGDAMFDVVRGGYDMQFVDAVIDRIAAEPAVPQRALASTEAPVTAPSTGHAE